MKEEKTSKFNLNKINHQWRNIMRETKSRELKKDIEILSQTFERVIDRKESVIKSLAQDLVEAEEQYSMALRSHLENVDNMIGNLFSSIIY
jgi:methanogenic corrinoid protein MtbC1